MEEKEVHLVKRISKELELTYKELGEEIGYSESIINICEDNLFYEIQLVFN